MTAPADPVILDFPFRGRWMARRSPARKVPSHGTHAFGVTYAIDFVAVDDRDRPAPRTWRTALATEPPQLFKGFGRPILAPVPGSVTSAHDGEPDHEARRSQLALIPYMLGQPGRARSGHAALAGNHVVIAVSPGGPYVTLAHLQLGTISVKAGDTVQVGDLVGRCGNSGNSTQPHVHVQVTTSTDWIRTRGLPLAFRREDGSAWVPGESEIFTC